VKLLITGNRKKTGELWAVCPLCKGQTMQGRATMAVNIEKRVGNCFRSGCVLQITSQVKLVDSKGKPAKLERTKLKKVAAEVITDTTFKQVGRENKSALRQRVADYVIGRGLDPEECPVYFRSDMPYYAFFLVKDKKGNTLFYQGRAIRDNVEPKTYNMWTNQKYCYVFRKGLFPKRLVFVEGIFDGAAVYDRSTMAACLLGSASITDSQAIQLSALLRVYPVDEIILFLDSDVDNKKIRRVVQDLLRTVRVDMPISSIKVVDWGGETGDPDSLLEAPRTELLRSAVPLPVFLSGTF